MQRIFFSIFYWHNPNLVGQSVYKDGNIDWIIVDKIHDKPRIFYKHLYKKLFIKYG